MNAEAVGVEIVNRLVVPLLGRVQNIEEFILDLPDTIARGLSPLAERVNDLTLRVEKIDKDETRARLTARVEALEAERRRQDLQLREQCARHGPPYRPECYEVQNESLGTLEVSQQQQRIVEAAIAHVNKYGSGTSPTAKELYNAVRNLASDQ